MATIYAKTGSQYMFATRSWNDPNTWDGGIVPTSSDTVIIAGQSFGNNSYPGISGTTYRQGGFKYNYGGLFYWKDKVNLILFAGLTGSIDPSGSVFGYTTTGELIKIDYSGTFQTTLSNQRLPGNRNDNVVAALLDASVDTSFSPWTSQYYPGTGSDGLVGFIPQIYSRFSTPAGVITLSGSETASFDTLIIDSGSKLHLTDEAQLNMYNKIFLYRGELKTSGSCMINFKAVYTGSAGTLVTNDNDQRYISVLNNAGSKFSMIGPEVRTNTTLSLSASVGDYFINVGSETGFAEGDHIFVGEENIIPYEITGSPYWSPRQRSSILSSMDEAFIVAATGSGKLYVSRVAALDAPVEFTASATEIVVDDDRYQVGDKVIVNGQTASVIAVEDYTYVLKDYDFSGSMTQNDLETEFFVSPDETFLNGYNPFQGSWKIIPGRGAYCDSAQPSSRFENYGYKYNIKNPSKLFPRDVYERNTKVEVWVNNNFLEEDQSIRKNTALQSYWTQSQVFVFTQVDPVKRFAGYYYEDYSSFLRVSLDRDLNSSNPLSPRFVFEPQRGSNSDNPSVHLPKVDPNYLYDTHKYTIDYYKGEYRIYYDDQLIQTSVDLTLGPTKGLAGLGIMPDISGQNRSWTVFPRMRISVTKQKLTLDNPVTGVLPGQKVYQSGVEYPHSTGNQVIKLQSFITDPLDFDNLVHSHRGFKDFANDGKHPVLRYFYDNINADIESGIVKRFGIYDTSVSTQRLCNILGHANLNFQDSVESSYNNRTNRPPFAAIFDLGESKEFNTVGWIDPFSGGASPYNVGIKYSNPIEISGSDDLENWTGITSSIDLRDSLTWQYFRDFTFPAQTFRYVLIKVPVNNLNYNWRVQGFRVLNNTANRIQVNNASDFEIGDTVTINNHATAWSDYNPSGRTSNVYPYIQAGSGSEDVIGDLKGREYTILNKSGNILTLDRSFRHGYLMKGDSVVKTNRASEIRGSYESGSWSTCKLLVQQHFVGTPYAYEGANDTELTLTNIGLRNFSNMFPQASTSTWRSGQREPIAWNGAYGPSKTVRFQGISYYGGPPDNYTPYIYFVNNYHIRHSNLGIFSGWLGLPYQSNTENVTYLFTSAYLKMLPVISTGNIGNIASNNYNRIVKVIQSYNYFYNDSLEGMRESEPSRYSGLNTPFGSLTSRRNTIFGQRFTLLGTPSYVGPIALESINYMGVLDSADNQIFGASARDSDLFGTQGTYHQRLRSHKNVLLNTQYMHQTHNLRYTTNPLFQGSSIPYSFGFNHSIGSPVIKFRNFNRWGVDIHRTTGFIVRKEHTQDYYRYYPIYYDYSEDYEYAFNRERGLRAFSSMFNARITSESPTTSSFTVAFTYRVDQSQKYSGRTSELGILTQPAPYEAIQTLEDTDLIYRSQYPINLSQFWYLTRSTRLSGYFYLVAVWNEEIVLFEPLAPNTDFTQVLRTISLPGQGFLEVFLAGTTRTGFYDLKEVSSVLETTDPENVIIRQNTFDTYTLFEKESNNLINFEHQIRDLSKAGKFRLKSARLS